MTYLSIGYTCPKIDATIEQLKDAVKLLDTCIGMLDRDNSIISELEYCQRLIEELYWGRKSNMELLRSANSELRAEAEYFAKKLETLEAEYDSLVESVETDSIA